MSMENLIFSHIEPIQGLMFLGVYSQSNNYDSWTMTSTDGNSGVIM